MLNKDLSTKTSYENHVSKDTLAKIHSTREKKNMTYTNTLIKTKNYHSLRKMKFLFLFYIIFKRVLCFAVKPKRSANSTAKFLCSLLLWIILKIACRWPISPSIQLFCSRIVNVSATVQTQSNWNYEIYQHYSSESEKHTIWSEFHNIIELYTGTYPHPSRFPIVHYRKYHLGRLYANVKYDLMESQSSGLIAAV